MIEYEAEVLARLIQDESALSPQIKRIGNGENVVILKNEPDRFFLWNALDWATHKRLWSRFLYTLGEVR